MPLHTILCDHRRRAEWRRLSATTGTRVRLSTDPLQGNVYLDPARLAASLGGVLDPLVLDLCEVAAYVYLADKAVSRGRYEKWVRDLSFHVPVRHPERWNAVRTLLTNTVGTLAGDNVQFHFVPKREASGPRLRHREVPPHPAPSPGASDCVALFSGGLDSFAGIVHLTHQGRRPLLASHYVSGIKSIQLELAAAVARQLGRPFEHFQYRVSSVKRAHTRHPLQNRESSHRARSFLFLSFATAAAAVRGLREIFICENGVLALNVPISEARKGTRSTHHAHPLYLSYFNQLVEALFERPFAVRNPFFYWTKREEVELLRDSGLRELIRDTVSCWGYPNLTLRFPDSNHCGVCIPCLVRRVSTVSAGLESWDDHYAADAFGPAGALPLAKRRNIEDLVYFAERFASHSKTELLRFFPELVMVHAGLDDVAGSRLDAMIAVYRRFANDLLTIAAERAPHLLSAAHAAA